MVECGAGAHCTTIGGPRRFGGNGLSICVWRCVWVSACVCSVFSHRCRGCKVGGACCAIDTYTRCFSGRTGGSALCAPTSPIGFCRRELRDLRNACVLDDDARDSAPDSGGGHGRRDGAGGGGAPASGLAGAAAEPERGRRVHGQPARERSSSDGTGSVAASRQTHAGIVSGNLAILGECGECGARGIGRTACSFSGELGMLPRLYGGSCARTDVRC